MVGAYGFRCLNLNLLKVILCQKYFSDLIKSFPLFSLYNVRVIVIQKEGSLCNLFKKVYLTKRKKESGRQRKVEEVATTTNNEGESSSVSQISKMTQVF